MDAALQMLLGWALVYQGKPAEAVEAFMIASRYEADRRNGLVGAVSVHLQAGQLGEADRLADELIGRYPNDRWAVLMKAMTGARRATASGR